MLLNLIYSGDFGTLSTFVLRQANLSGPAPDTRRLPSCGKLNPVL